MAVHLGGERRCTRRERREHRGQPARRPFYVLTVMAVELTVARLERAASLSIARRGPGVRILG